MCLTTQIRSLAQPGSFANCKNVKQLETTSSFGSTSSLPSLLNLLPVRVRADDGSGIGIRAHDQQDEDIDEESMEEIHTQST